MSIVTMTADSIGESLGADVPELYVMIAKNSVAGMDSGSMAELLGVPPAEVQEIMNDSLYKSVRLLIATEYASTQVETDLSWDSIENEALRGLNKRVKFEKDTDTLLRIAAVANKAQRRTSPAKGGILDPANGGTRVPLTLTSRIVHRLSASGASEIEETRQISVLDGSASNPKFEDIDALLGVSRQRDIPRVMKAVTHDSIESVEDLEWKG